MDTNYNLILSIVMIFKITPIFVSKHLVIGSSIGWHWMSLLHIVLMGTTAALMHRVDVRATSETALPATLPLSLTLWVIIYYLLMHMLRNYTGTSIRLAHKKIPHFPVIFLLFAFQVSIKRGFDYFKTIFKILHVELVKDK